MRVSLDVSRGMIGLSRVCAQRRDGPGPASSRSSFRRVSPRPCAAAEGRLLRLCRQRGCREQGLVLVALRSQWVCSARVGKQDCWGGRLLGGGDAGGWPPPPRFVLLWLACDPNRRRRATHQVGAVGPCGLMRDRKRGTNSRSWLKTGRSIASRRVPSNRDTIRPSSRPWLPAGTWRANRESCFSGETVRANYWRPGSWGGWPGGAGRSTGA
jgi:hypothetical protein